MNNQEQEEFDILGIVDLFATFLYFGEYAKNKKMISTNKLLKYIQTENRLLFKELDIDTDKILENQKKILENQEEILNLLKNK